MSNKNSNYQISSASIAGIKKVNEDACWVGCNSHKQCLSIVCDGIGSEEGSENVSRFVVEFFQQEFVNTRKILFVDSWFKKTLDACFKALKTRYLKTVNHMGTTLIVAIVSKHNVYCYHIGDSRLYYYSKQTNNWTKKTTDHNLYNLYQRTHAPEAVYLKNKDKLLSLTNYIDSQTDKFMKYTACKFKVKAGDNILLCSDGLYNYLRISKIANLISLCQEEDFGAIATKLVQEALLNGSNDNITSVLIEINK